ncbi:hypothetical protein, partial [Burkholderia pseudomallei]|uniref:hypothetical protein n=1 Tax=Burkholderia pseudomallei TaxID=28450 RepID=UPI0019D40956
MTGDDQRRRAASGDRRETKAGWRRQAGWRAKNRGRKSVVSGRESTAAQHSDGLLILDEIGQ